MIAIMRSAVGCTHCITLSSSSLTIPRLFRLSCSQCASVCRAPMITPPPLSAMRPTSISTPPPPLACCHRATIHLPLPHAPFRPAGPARAGRGVRVLRGRVKRRGGFCRRPTRDRVGGGRVQGRRIVLPAPAAGPSGERQKGCECVVSASTWESCFDWPKGGRRGLRRFGPSITHGRDISRRTLRRGRCGGSKRISLSLCLSLSLVLLCSCLE